ncbi:MAG: hypothetical protein JSV80_14435 [Acidobacteriota bacterium]|nr:MAG: hypothetical protein JSV80_14435 [Acidobacteriota bacterium]
MNDRAITRIAKLCAAICVAGLAACLHTLAQRGELSIQAGALSGDYGGPLKAETQWTSIVYKVGDEFQFRAELPFVRVRYSDAVIQTVLGPVPDPGGEGPGWGEPIASPGADGPGPGPGSNGPRSGSGPGSGSESGPESDPPGPGGDDPGSSTVARAATTLDPSEQIVRREAPWQTGQGDLQVGVSRRLAGGGVKVYRMDLGVDVKVPTADEEKLLGTGEWDYRGFVSGQYAFWSVTGFAGMSWTSLGDPEGLILEDVFDAYIGLASEPIRGRVLLSGWLEGTEQVVEGIGARSALGFGFQTLGRVRFRLQATAGLSDAAEDYSVIAGLAFGIAPVQAGPPAMAR